MANYLRLTLLTLVCMATAACGPSEAERQAARDAAVAKAAADEEARLTAIREADEKVSRQVAEASQLAAEQERIDKIRTANVVDRMDRQAQVVARVQAVIADGSYYDVPSFACDSQEQAMLLEHLHIERSTPTATTCRASGAIIQCPPCL